jgi:hypothetical protein
MLAAVTLAPPKKRCRRDELPHRLPGLLPLKRASWSEEKFEPLGLLTPPSVLDIANVVIEYRTCECLLWVIG